MPNTEGYLDGTQILETTHIVIVQAPNFCPGADRQQLSLGASKSRNDGSLVVVGTDLATLFGVSRNCDVRVLVDECITSASFFFQDETRHLIQILCLLVPR